jgi:hypothetical protein
MKFPLFGLLSLLLVGSTPSMAQSVEFFPVEEVRAGMQGTGKTVFQGTQVESFDVEILGVLENVTPKGDLILARLSGANLEHLGVFSGMSGSPVYIDGKLVGAIAYAFNFAKEPIAGITPIHQMVRIFQEQAPTSIRLSPRMNPSELYEMRSLEDLVGKPAERFPLLGALQTMGALRPIATPLNLPGFHQAAVTAYSSFLESLGFAPIAGSASARIDEAIDATLEPGSTVTVGIVRGDMNASASGTVTHVDGNRIYAFGHPFLSIGYTDMPMHKGSVLGVVPSLSSSQKLSGSGPFIGSIRQDRATGIMGIRDEKPKMIPVKLHLRTSRNESKQYEFEIVNDDFLAPFLLTFAIHNSIIASERAIGGQTLQVRCRISLQGHPDVNFQNNVADLASSPALAAVTAAAPVNFILNSGFENIVVEGVDLEIVATERINEASLDKIWLNKLKARPGEELELTVFLRRANGEVASDTYPLKIPDAVQPGPLKISVGDGLTLTRADSRLNEGAEFIPRDLRQLVRAINNLKKNDRLYIRLFREEKGAVIGGEGMPHLPPSLLALYGSNRTSGDVRPINRSVYIEHELPATDGVLAGHQVIEIEIEG